MSDNPGNAGGRFKSFHTKHYVFFSFFFLFFSFGSGTALRILYCCPSFAPDCTFLCSCNAQRKRSKHDFSKGQSRQGIWEISASLSQTVKVHRLCEGTGKRRCQVYGWVNIGAQGIKQVPFVSTPVLLLSSCAIPSPTHCLCFLLVFTHRPITSPWRSTPAVSWSSERYTGAFNPLQTST